MKKIRFLTLLLCAVMLFAAMSATAFAADCTKDAACTAETHDAACPKYVAPALTLKDAELDVCLGGYLRNFYTLEGTDPTVTVTSSDPDVAKVYNSGKILGKRNGTAVITVTATNALGTVSASFTLNVGHDYDVLYNDTVHWTVCTRCDYKSSEDPHDMRDWKIIRMPSGDNAGLERRSCRGCNLAEMRDLDPASAPPTGDDSNIGLWVVTAALSLMALTGSVLILKKRHQN